jgi:hypothetical protein
MNDPTIWWIYVGAGQPNDGLLKAGAERFVKFDDHMARIAALESALQLIGNELDLHADQGPAGEAFRALLVPTLETSGVKP